MLEVIHDCFDKVFKHSIERKSLINNMTAVILVIDELIDSGIVMATETNTILKRINIKPGAGMQPSASTSAAEAQPEAGSSGGGMFASVFASARS